MYAEIGNAELSSAELPAQGVGVGDAGPVVVRTQREDMVQCSVVFDWFGGGGGVRVGAARFGFLGV